MAGYGDVAEDTWYTNAVQWSTDNGITGIETPCFEPGSAVSRGETAVWIYNMENQPEPGDFHSFTDVTVATQHAAISWMYFKGITTGTSDTTFSPDETLTRAQIATFLHRLAEKPVAPPHSFGDVAAAWQQDGVSWMAHTGITTGTSDTTFSPDDTLTRAQLVTFLYRYKNTPNVTINASTTDCDPNAETPADLLAASFSAVSAGSRHSCGLRTDNTVVCWGNNDAGQLDAPADTFETVSAGWLHSCAIRTDSTITCWGDDDAKRLDPPAEGFENVSTGGLHSCAIRADGTIACWGEHDWGEIDSPDGTFKAVSTGGLHSCAIRTDDTIICWGDTPAGGLDDDTTNARAGNYKTVNAGGLHTCAIRNNDTITCWGTNGQLDTPDGRFKTVSAGGLHTCAIHADDTITCWGTNNWGQADPPQGNFKAVSAGGLHTCAIRADDTITCWGRDYAE
ncbi:MAG: S-layer homology domain-containing protein [Acidimicrobiaceae bacterium]|nr:S-layer homology domain-containing protein [Acidimicrobiaceae bacterium]